MGESEGSPDVGVEVLQIVERVQHILLQTLIPIQVVLHLRYAQLHEVEDQSVQLMGYLPIGVAEYHLRQTCAKYLYALLE